VLCVHLALALCPSDPDYLLIGYDPGGLVLWCLSSQESECRYECPKELPCRSLAWHESGDFFASGTGSEVLKVTFQKIVSKLHFPNKEILCKRTEKQKVIDTCTCVDVTWVVSQQKRNLMCVGGEREEEGGSPASTPFPITLVFCLYRLFWKFVWQMIPRVLNLIFFCSGHFNGDVFVWKKKSTTPMNRFAGTYFVSCS